MPCGPGLLSAGGNFRLPIAYRFALQRSEHIRPIGQQKKCEVNCCRCLALNLARLRFHTAKTHTWPADAACVAHRLKRHNESRSRHEVTTGGCAQISLVPGLLSPRKPTSFTEQPQLLTPPAIAPSLAPVITRVLGTVHGAHWQRRSCRRQGRDHRLC